jgi:Tfp pilus assembly protein PilZ
MAMADEKGKAQAKGKQPPCQVTYFIENKPYKGTSIYFNELGMLVHCQQPAPLNERMKMILEFPHLNKPIEVLGEVVWTNRHGTDDPITPRGMGVKFNHEDNDVVRILAEIAISYETPDNVYRCYYT